MADFEELRLQVSLVDGASAGLRTLNSEISKLAGTVKSIAPELAKANKEIVGLTQTLKPVKSYSSDLVELGTTFAQLATSAGLLGNMGSAGGALGVIFGRYGLFGVGLAATVGTIVGITNSLRDFARGALDLEHTSRAAGLLPDQFKNLTKQLEDAGYTAEQAESEVTKFTRTMREITHAGTPEFLKAWRETADKEKGVKFYQQINELIRQGRPAEAMQRVVNQGMERFHEEMKKNPETARRGLEAYLENSGLSLRAQDIENLTDEMSDPTKQQRRSKLAREYLAELAKTRHIWEDFWEKMKTDMLPSFREFNKEFAKLEPHAEAIGKGFVFVFRELGQTAKDVIQVIRDIKEIKDWLDGKTGPRRDRTLADQHRAARGRFRFGAGGTTPGGGDVAPPAGSPGLGVRPGVGGGGGGGGAAPAGGARAPAAGGGDGDRAPAPASGSGAAPAGDAGRAASNNRTERIAAAKAAMEDQLRREGVPEANIREAANLLTGQALAESQLVPGTRHDQGTGYGIYGARLERRTAMLAWMKENGYAPNSLEGQSRYMAHEAMSKRYDATRRALMGATPENRAANVRTLTRNFEAPADQGPGQMATRERYTGEAAGVSPRAVQSPQAGPDTGANAGPPATRPDGGGTAPPLGPTPGNRNIPFHYQGTITIEGKQYRYGSGGGGRGSTPPGSYPVNIGRGDIGPLGRERLGSVATVGGLGGVINDPRYPGAPRTGIQIHPGTSNRLDQLYSAGCFAVHRDDWPRFKAHLLDLHSRTPGGLRIDVARDGRAQIVASGQTIPLNATSPDARSAVSNSGLVSGGGTGAGMPQLPPGVTAVPRYSTDPATGERTQVGTRFVSGRGASKDWRNRLSPEARAWARRQLPGGDELDRAQIDRPLGQEVQSTVRSEGQMKVDVTAPRGTRVSASGHGLFRRVAMTRQMPMKTAAATEGASAEE